MANEKTGVTGILIWAFLMVIVGVSLIGVIAEQANSAVDLTRVPAEAVAIERNSSSADTNESIAVTLANPPTGWKKADCPLIGVVVSNSSGTAFTVTTDYTTDLTAGTITFVNSTNTVENAFDNVTSLSYDYCADDYLNSSWGRTVLPLVAGFFALGLLGVGIALLFKAGKQTGII